MLLVPNEGRSHLGAAIVLCAAVALTFGACDGGSDAPPVASATSVVATSSLPPATPFPTDEGKVDLASLIDTRGALPDSDPIDLARRYQHLSPAAPTALAFAGEPSVGAGRSFIVSRITADVLTHKKAPESITISATMLVASEHAYFYVDEALSLDAGDIQQAAEMFETTVWPVVTGVFGEPETPGIDGDPRIIVLYADLGGGVGGYYSGDDTFVKAVRPLSNEAEMVYLDRSLQPGGASFNVVLAHELQHLIQRKNDGGEESWVNEGLSEAALMLAGGAASTIGRFEAAPETQLNAWSIGGNQPHYGAAAAFLRYVASRFGGDAALGEIAKKSGDGPAGIDQFLTLTGTRLRFRDVFVDWIAANILNLDSGPYANPDRRVEAQVQYEIAPGDSVEEEGQQFGTDYFALTNIYDGGAYVLRFQGERDVGVLPPSALEEGPVWWSNRGEGIDTTLTYAVDLVGAINPRFTFRTWYDIEPWYDFGYVSVSIDGGANWEALAGDRTTTDDPMRLALGPGYSGRSGDGEDAAWVDERVELARFAGQRILLRFEYVTDGGSHAEGWAIRDVGIDGTADDLRLNVVPVAAGWANIDRPLAQAYVARLILTMDDGTAEVRDLPLSSSQAGELRLRTDGVSDAVLAIAGATEGTNEKAPYIVELIRQ